MENTNTVTNDHNKRLQIAYVIETFPSSTEYFILNEIISLESQGVNILVLSIRRPKYPISAQGINGHKASVIYASNISLFSQVIHCIKHFKKVIVTTRYSLFSW
jgi:hypothetical protein